MVRRLAWRHTEPRPATRATTVGYGRDAGPVDCDFHSSIINDFGDGRVVLDVVGVDTNLRWPLDRDRLRQACTNMLQNALQASPNEKLVRGMLTAHNTALRIIVEDEGPGIAEDKIDRIFEPFVTGRVRGTGLGLAIARRIVEQHGGTVVAENRSSPTGGARFTTTLPRLAERNIG